MKILLLTVFGILCTIVYNTTHTVNYEDDNNLFAALLNSECGLCSETELYLVGSVVINRMSDSRFPRTLRAVILQKGQFAGISSADNFRPTKKTLRIVKKLQSGLYVTPDIIFFCTYKSSTYPMSEVLVKAQHHVFGK